MDDQADDRDHRKESWQPLPVAPATPAATRLSAGLWAWQGTQMGDGTTIAVGDPSRYTIQFNPDGSLAIRADCNQVIGTYTVNGPRLTLTLGASTLVGCPPDSREDVFRRQLGEIASYTLDQSNLFLAPRVDGGIMRFAALTPATLTGTTWRATGINNGRGVVESLVSGTVVTAIFGTGGTVRGSAGCNTFNGGYQVSGAALTIGPLASTRMACSPEAIMTQEQAYLTALQAATTYAITADWLELRDAGGALQVGFVA